MPPDRLSHWLEAFEASRARERGEFARLLHDETGGKLTAAGIELTLLRMDAPPEWGPRLDALENALEAAFSSVRAASLSAAPDLAERISLADALSRMAETAGRRFDGTLAFTVDTEYRPDAKTASALFRIAESVVSYLTVETHATTVELVIEAGPVMKVQGNIEWDRSGASSSLALSIARYYAAKTNLRFLFGKSAAGSTMLVIQR